jgi:hydroxyacylglutathione hydrolase
MEITSGIHQINGVRGANCYLILTESKMLVIDTGLPGNGKQIINYVRGLEKNPADIGYIILTHAHIDHIGSAAELKKMTDAKLVIHTEDAAILSGKSGFKTGGGFLGMLAKLLTPLMRFHPVEPDIILRENSEISGFQVIHTPGHTKGSISLYLPGKLIFVGDVLNRRFTLDKAQAKASSSVISGLEFDILLPGHGAPVIGKASTKIKELVEHNWRA